MRTKTLCLVAIAAVVTLSFSFASVKTQQPQKNTESKSERILNNEPIGGFALEDKF